MLQRGWALNHAKWENPVMKDHMLYYSIYQKQPD